jgi:hypothetical protein
MPPRKPKARQTRKPQAKRSPAATAPGIARLAAAPAPAPGKLSRAETDAIVDSCIAAAAPGRPYNDSTPLSSIPVHPDDLNGCLNDGLDLVDPFRYTSGTISSSWTVKMLKTDAYNRYVASHP